MRIGLTGGAATPEKIVEQAQHAEADGFHSLWYASVVQGDPLVAMALADAPGISVLVVPGCLVLGVFAINLGMYCSLVSRTSFRATVTTVSVLLAVGLGHWVLYPVGLVLLQVLGRPDLRHGLAVFHGDGLTPSQMLTTLATAGEFLSGKQAAGEWGTRLLAALAGLLLYAGLAALLWVRLRSRFGTLTGRVR